MRTTFDARVLSLALWLACVACGDSTAPDDMDGPTVRAIVPDVGSTLGGSEVRLSGTGLADARVTIGGLTVTGFYDNVGKYGSLHVVTAPHPAGYVDVVVTSSSGGKVIIPGAYRYVEPQTFDFNGTWAGFVFGSHAWIEFTIRDNSLVSVSCDGVEFVSSDHPASVSRGEFRFYGDGLVIFSGRIVDALTAVGNITSPLCFGSEWSAKKAG